MTQAKYITLIENDGGIVWNTGERKWDGDQRKVIKPPERGRGSEKKWGRATYTAIDGAWMRSRDFEIWLREQAKEWGDEIEAKPVYDWPAFDGYLPPSRPIPNPEPNFDIELVGGVDQ